METEIIGLSGLSFDLSVSISEMKEWEVGEIVNFFRGLAIITSALNPNNWD